MTVASIMQWAECQHGWSGYSSPSPDELTRIAVGVAIVTASHEDAPIACSPEITLPENGCAVGYEPGGSVVHTHRVASHDRARLHTAAEAAENPRMRFGIPTALRLGLPGGSR